MQLLQRQHHMPCLYVWQSQKCWKPLYKLQHHKLSFQPCISQVRHTPPPKEGDVPFNQNYSLKALTEWHLRPKNHFLIFIQSFSRIEARKAWLASVSTVFHYTTLYWNQYIDILILTLILITQRCYIDWNQNSLHIIFTKRCTLGRNQNKIIVKSYFSMCNSWEQVLQLFVEVKV